ncbi:MAG: hypothetical protein ABIF89_00700 [bacterium]
MDLLLRTAIGVATIEALFFVFSRFLIKRKYWLVFNFVFSVFVWIFSFGNAAAVVYQYVFSAGRSFTILNVFLFVFNIAYGFWWGMKRIVGKNEKTAN